MSLHHRLAHRQRGQSMVEFCIVVPLFLFLLLLILQMVLIYRAKSTLDYATFQAARTGAVNGADPDAMRNRLALGLVPLWTHSPDLGGVAAARAKTQGELLLGHATLEVISPTKQMWNQFRERQYDGRLALPNDTLQYASAREHDDERHICPLQLEVIRRGIRLWTKPGDVVLSPFTGIGSEGYVAVQMGRKFVGAELKASYYRQAVANLQNAIKQGDLLEAA